MCICFMVFIQLLPRAQLSFWWKFEKIVKTSALLILIWVTKKIIQQKLEILAWCVCVFRPCVGAWQIFQQSQEPLSADLFEAN